VYDVRVVETTIFWPWFYIAGDSSAFTLIRNTTDLTVNFTVNWRNSAGAIAGTFSGSLAGNADTILNARSFVNPATAASGSVEIVHTGSEDALKASTTTLSSSTGLSFDAASERVPIKRFVCDRGIAFLLWRANSDSQQRHGWRT
jgi:hypothetical protein